MPIGKNAIKRVENNGYSKVKTSAPDMENSTEFPLAPKPMKKKSTVKAPTIKKSSPRSNAEKAVKNDKPSSVPVAEPIPNENEATSSVSGVVANVSSVVIEKVLSGESETSYVNLGRDLPVHLL